MPQVQVLSPRPFNPQFYAKLLKNCGFFLFDLAFITMQISLNFSILQFDVIFPIKSPQFI
nr:MAG TPA: hypothetical protein [Caudoviricetes sp.]